MHRRLFARPFSVAELKKPSLSTIVVGLGIWIGFPTVAAYQDMTSMVLGMDNPAARWSAYVEEAVAGSVHSAEMPFADGDLKAGAISGAGVNAPGVGKIAFRSKGAASENTPDEERITRADKKGRVVKIAPVAPPKAFSAGSVLERSSSLMEPRFDGGLKMAFATPTIKGKEIEIATAFYVKRKKQRDPGISSVIADLVTNDKPDVLATAYAPAAPDYARASPFETLLQDDPDNGRFIPPVASGDHDWMATPLPASVFSKEEQKCLATAVYFEARGENPRGQAAVAQVVLNRVRNPAYPKTVCGVVYQNDNWRNACQFSFACDGIKDRITSPYHYKLAQEVAMAVTAGKIFIPEVGSSTHYHATYVRPRWSRTMEKMKKIGLHIFYRTHGGGWS
ncbi:cell wall hydrolase [Mesorhizobium sp. 1B3]|uniref:cell wall hydrolase n=1 Tax=Mesorhizobium sp. 1B3 TaxID=3243599 RepID=UPI003D99A9CF